MNESVENFVHFSRLIPNPKVVFLMSDAAKSLASFVKEICSASCFCWPTQFVFIFI